MSVVTLIAICKYKSSFTCFILSKASFKEDTSPLTTADTASNEVLTTYFREKYPAYSILTEEESSAADLHGMPERLSNNAGVFIIDPLDGTKEFIHRNGEFCVSIGFASHNRVYAGVIAVPAKRLLYYAAEGHGSYKISFDGIPENVFDEAKSSWHWGWG